MQANVDNKRVAKNTMVLYFRMLFQMIVYLYISRAIIRELGMSDYGIFDVVGAAIGILVFLNNSMLNCTQRFITFAIGKGNVQYLQNVYSVSLIIHISLAVILLIFGETVGLWYVSNYMVIPPERMSAALVVYHCSLLSSVFMVMSVPYNSSIVAYEKMTAFAGISILDVTLKLVIVLALPFMGGDKLKIYAYMLLAEAFFIRLVYSLYCKLNFEFLKFRWIKNRKLYREMLGFAGWSTFGNFALVCNTQGLNLLLNAFGGTLLNAARGAAFQVQTAVTAFTASFQTAINPQITKSYASDDLVSMNKLVLRSSRFSYFLLLFIALPLMLEMPVILKLWLTEVPRYAVAFTRLLLCVTLVDAIANSMTIGVAATGQIKIYHITIGFILICALPLAWFLVRVTGNPVMAFVAQLTVVITAQLVRLFFCRNLFCLNIKDFVREVFVPVMRVSLVAGSVSYMAHCCLSVGLWGRVGVVVISWFVIAVTLFFFGLTKYERFFIKTKIYLK